MAIYRCLQSGNTVEFKLPHDIESMKGHDGYTRIDEDEEDVNEDSIGIRFTPIYPSKKQGRPRKAQNV